MDKVRALLRSNDFEFSDLEITELLNVFVRRHRKSTFNLPVVLFIYICEFLHARDTCALKRTCKFANRHARYYHVGVDRGVDSQHIRSLLNCNHSSLVHASEGRMPRLQSVAIDARFLHPQTLADVVALLPNIKLFISSHADSANYSDAVRAAIVGLHVGGWVGGKGPMPVFPNLETLHFLAGRLDVTILQAFPRLKNLKCGFLGPIKPTLSPNTIESVVLYYLDENLSNWVSQLQHLKQLVILSDDRLPTKFPNSIQILHVTIPRESVLDLSQAKLLETLVILDSMPLDYVKTKFPPCLRNLEIRVCFMDSAKIVQFTAKSNVHLRNFYVTDKSVTLQGAQVIVANMPKHVRVFFNHALFTSINL